MLDQKAIFGYFRYLLRLQNVRIKYEKAAAMFESSTFDFVKKLSFMQK